MIEESLYENVGQFFFCFFFFNYCIQDSPKNVEFIHIPQTLKKIRHPIKSISTNIILNYTLILFKLLSNKSLVYYHHVLKLKKLNLESKKQLSSYIIWKNWFNSLILILIKNIWNVKGWMQCLLKTFGLIFIFWQIHMSPEQVLEEYIWN